LFPSIQAVVVVLLVKGIILPYRVVFLCTSLSQLRLIYYHIVTVHTLKDWGILQTLLSCSHHLVSVCSQYFDHLLVLLFS
jgi:hypothetical protein